MDETSMIRKGIRGLAAIALPLSAPAGPWGLGRLVGWLSHALAIGAMICGLAYLNDVLDLEKALHSPWPSLHAFWLPLLFMLVYLLCWLAYALGRWLLGLERPTVAFPDIEAAWGEAACALQRAGIGVDDVPLYLVLGRPASGEAKLFQAAGLALVVPQTPARFDAPLHVFASREAIFVTCAESSLLGRQAKRFAEKAGSAQSLAPETARLQYLCRLLVKKRHPYCPINGLIMLIPWAATSGKAVASQVAELTQHDVHAVHQSLQIDCPFFVMVCDLETVPGFRDFVGQLTGPERLRPFGQRFTLVPDIDPSEIQDVVGKGLASLCDDVLTAAICRRFRPDIATEAAGELPAPMRANVHLYQLFAQLRQGCRHLSSILYRGTQTEVGAAAMLAGCYLAATGADAAHEQAFVADLFQELLQSQNFVAWSPQALAAEAGYRRRTRLGYLALGLVLVVMGALGYAALFGGKWPLAA